MTISPPARPGVRTEGGWFGPADRPLAGWLTRPLAGHNRVGVLMLPSVGYQYWSAHRALRALAELLAEQGATVLRADYGGTGDSAGDQGDAGRVAEWRSLASWGAAALRRAGADHIVVVGVRLGATFALLDSADIGAEAVVAWAPVVSGQRYGREIALLGEHVPLGPWPGGMSGTVAAGTVWTEETMRALKQLKLTAAAVPPASRILVVDDASGHYDEWAAGWRDLGARVDIETCPESGEVLRLPTEDVEVPVRTNLAIARWIKALPGSREASTPSATVESLENPVSFTWRDDEVTEEVITVGTRELTCIRCAPNGPGADQVEAGTAVVFVNSGSEPHIGPGRAWVEFGRDLAAAGYVTFRLDYSGWGESPDLDHAPGRPYDQHTVGETSDVVDALHEQGLRLVFLVGLCAGAWISMAAARKTAVDGVIALNPQLYWQPGDVVEALMADTHARRETERARHRRWAKVGLWSVLDAVGVRHPAGRWLNDLRRRGTPILLLFSSNDDGAEFLRARVGRSLRRALRSSMSLVELEEIDHSMHRVWRRADVVGAMTSFLDAHAHPAPQRRLGGATSKTAPSKS